MQGRLGADDFDRPQLGELCEELWSFEGGHTACEAEEDVEFRHPGSALGECDHSSKTESSLTPAGKGMYHGPALTPRLSESADESIGQISALPFKLSP